MKNYFLYFKYLVLLLIIFSGVLSCNKSDPNSRSSINNADSEEIIYHEMLKIGERLEDPYSVKNVEKAINKLYPTKAGRIEVKPSHLYVRFLPKDIKEVETLEKLGLHLLDHPLDHKIIKEGDYYHDPSIEEGKITWQYTTVPIDFSFPSGIKHEVLDKCHMSENNIYTKGDNQGIDWEEVEREAYRMTGNEDMLDLLSTKANDKKPAGRITIVDDKKNEGKPFGVSGVKVSCNSFVKFASAYTDRDGYYQMNKKFFSKPRYRLIFENKKGFNIGLNLLLVKGSISTLGKGETEGKDFQIDKNSDRKMFARAVVNNATYDYYDRCDETDMHIDTPPGDLRIWLLQHSKQSVTIMMNKGTDSGTGLKLIAKLIPEGISKYLPFFKFLAPDLLIGLEGRNDYAEIYSETCHELAHASHFSKVSTEYWTKYCDYLLTSFLGGITSFFDIKSEKDAGYCEISEMWAYFLQTEMYKERYGGNLIFGTSFWFRPQIFSNLSENGFSKYQLFKVLTKDINSKEGLQKKLCTSYPQRKKKIDQIFNRYDN